MTDFMTTLSREFWATLAEMSPYLLFGFFVAGLLNVFISASLVEQHLGGRGLWPIIKASLFGVPLPLCSCGVIPVSMSLHKHGAGKAATIAFLLSTPQTGIDSILVTYSLMGPIFAIFRPLAALITGLIGGSIENLIDQNGANNQPQPPKPPCTDSCCADKNQSGKLARLFKYGFVTLPADIGPAMFLGLIIAALIAAIVPDDYFAQYLSAGGAIAAMVLMMFIGIPIYVCATASVPIAVALIAKGLNPGAAFVFLVTGPATNAAGLATIWATLGRKSAIAYLLSVTSCSLIGGIILDAIFRGDVSQITHAHGFMLPKWIESVSAVILLGVLIVGIIRKLHPKNHH